VHDLCSEIFYSNRIYLNICYDVGTFISYCPELLTYLQTSDLAGRVVTGARLHVLAAVLEVEVPHGALLGRGRVQRLVANVVNQLRLVVPERDADVVRVTERQVTAIEHIQPQRGPERHLQICVLPNSNNKSTIAITIKPITFTPAVSQNRRVGLIKSVCRPLIT